MSPLSFQSTLVLGLAGAAIAAPATGVLRPRQEVKSVAEPTDAIGVLTAALATFSAPANSSSALSVSDAATLTTTGEATAVTSTSTTETSGAVTEDEEGDETEEDDETEESDDVEETSGTDTDLSRDEFCDEAGLNDLDTVISIWNGKYLDDFLSKDDFANEPEWVVKMATAAFKGTGTSGGWNCGEYDLTCFKTTDLNCNTMFDRGFGYEYWIFKAVQNVQNTMERANRELVISTTGGIIDIPIINDDFKVELKEPNALLKFIGAAFGMAGGLVAYGRFASAAGKLWRDDAKATATLFGASFAASAAESPATPPDASVDMYRALKKIFDGQNADVDKWLSLAVGGEGDKNELPDRGPVEGGDPKSAISGFFAQGRWILENDDAAKYIKQAFEFIDNKMVDVALDSLGYKILNDDNHPDEDSCEEQPYAYWLDLDGGSCMRLTYQDGSNNIYPPVKEDVMKLMESEYGFDVRDYFERACDCAINGSEDKLPALDDLPEDGKPPQCFYTVTCQNAEIWLNGDNPDDDDDWVIGWPTDF